MSSFAFYQKVVALNSNVHRNLKFDAGKVGFDFVRDTTAVLLASIEFAEAGREYPVVFIRGQDGKMRPVALLGVRTGENLYVDEQGTWGAALRPGFHPALPLRDGGGRRGRATAGLH